MENRSGTWGQEITVEVDNMGKVPFHEIVITMWLYYEHEDQVAKEAKEPVILERDMQFLDKRLVKVFVPQPSQGAPPYHAGSVRSVWAAPPR